MSNRNYENKTQVVVNQNVPIYGVAFTGVKYMKDGL